MKPIDIKFTKYLGRRPLKPLKTQESRLLKILWERSGSVSETARQLDIIPQNLTAWRGKGRVAYQQIGIIAQFFGITPWAFDYRGLKDVFGDAPKWDKVLKNCRLTKDELIYIKNGTSPSVGEVKHRIEI